MTVELKLFEFIFPRNVNQNFFYSISSDRTILMWKYSEESVEIFINI